MNSLEEIKTAIAVELKNTGLDKRQQELVTRILNLKTPNPIFSGKNSRDIIMANNTLKAAKCNDCKWLINFVIGPFNLHETNSRYIQQVYEGKEPAKYPCEIPSNTPPAQASARTFFNNWLVDLKK